MLAAAVALVALLGWGTWNALDRTLTDESVSGASVVGAAAGPAAGSGAPGVGGPATATAGSASASDIVPDPASVAVLPFTTIGGDPDADAYAQGMAVALIDNLGTVPGVKVLASTSSFAGSNDDPAAAGRELGVATVLQGQVQFFGTQLQATVQLVDVASGNLVRRIRNLWDKDDLDGIFAFQEDVGRQVVEALEIELSGDEAARLAVRPTHSAAAYDAYLRGIEAMPRRTGPSLNAALRHFQSAVELDPDFAQAHLGLSQTYLLQRNYQTISQSEAIARAQASAERALELDPSLGGAEAMLALLAQSAGDPDWRERFERALELAPNDALAHTTYGNAIWMRSGDGASRRAWEVWTRAYELNPLGAAQNENLGWLSFTNGRFDDAVRWMDRAIELDAEYPLGYMGKGAALTFSGRAEEAIPELETALRLNPEDSGRHLANLANAYGALGMIDEAGSALKGRATVALASPGRAREVAELYHTVGGDLPQAEGWYREALQRGFHQRAALGAMLLALDRGDASGAEAMLADATERLTVRESARASPAERGWNLLARLNLALYQGRLAEAGAFARELAEMVTVGGPERYSDNWALYAYQHPIEPVGYFGLVAGEPQISRRYFEVNFPTLLGDDPPVHAFTLKAAIDLAAVLQQTGGRSADGATPAGRSQATRTDVASTDSDKSRAELLLQRAAAYLESLPATQRRHQFRGAAAEIYALQGRSGEALDALEQAIDDDFLSGWWRLEHKPHFESLRDEPRFRQAVRRLRAEATG